MATDDRYVVTFSEAECNEGKAATILDVQKKSVKDGYEILGFAEDVDESQTLHFEQLGTSVVTLDEEGVKRLQDDERVAEVVPDFEVEAHGDCGCGGSAGGNSGQDSFDVYAPDNLDPFSAGYQQAINDLVGQLGSDCGGGETELIEPTAHRCPPGQREICFWIFGRRFCFCVPGGPPVPPSRPSPSPRQAIPWNIQMVRANRVWHRVDGSGVNLNRINDMDRLERILVN